MRAVRQSRDASIGTPGTAVLPHAGAPVTTLAPPRNAAGPWQQWLFSYGVGRLYDATLGPALRQGTEALLGHPHTPAYVPPATIPFTVRDMLTGALYYVVGQRAFDLFERITHQGASSGTNLLTTSGGMAGAQAARGFGAAAFRHMATQTIAMSVLFTMLDAVVGNYVGPAIERGVSRVVGAPVVATTRTAADGTIPQTLMRVDVEQMARNLAHNILGGITYSAALSTVGSAAARTVVAAVPGLGGALLGALGSALIASAAAGVVDSMVGTQLANVAQDLVRDARHLIGQRSSTTPPGDVIAVPGDRLSGSVKGVLVPFATALMAGQTQQFVRALVPPAPPGRS